jgi:hypothetical protein
LPQAAINEVWIEAAIRALTQRAAGQRVMLVDHNLVSRTSELLSERKASRSGTDDDHFLTASPHRRHRLDPSLGECPLDNMTFDLANRDRVGRMALGASQLTALAAKPSGEFREVVGGVEQAARFFPIAMVHQLVNFRNPVSQHATFDPT